MKLILMLFSLLSLPVYARLAPTTLKSFLAESELVVEASPLKLERTGVQAGSATFKVLRVLKGSYEAPQIEIKWGDEVHDQQITNLEHDYLLFLKKSPEGTYTGAQYGRSYWPFTSRVTDPQKANLDSEERGFSYDYPVSMVTLNGDDKKMLVPAKPPASHSGKAPFISMAKLKALLQKK